MSRTAPYLWLIALSSLAAPSPGAETPGEIVLRPDVMAFTATSLPADEVAALRKGQHVHGYGWVEYTIDAPEAGAYELWITSAASWEQRYIVNGEAVAETRADQADLGKRGDELKIANVELKHGDNTLRILRDWHPGLAWISSLLLRRAAVPEARVLAAPLNYLGYYRRGDRVTLDLRAEGIADKPYRLDVVLEPEKGPRRLINTRQIAAGTGWSHATVAVPLDFDGLGAVRVLADNVDCMRPANVVVFDMARRPIAPTGEASWDLVQTIDCVARPPDYSGNGAPRVACGPAGTYRESADNGSYTVGSRQASWFAYTLNTPHAGQWYRLEVDYPDDDIRTFTISLFDYGNYGGDPAVPYPVDGGVSCGAEYAPSDAMQTYTMHCVPRRADPRLVFFNWHQGLRAAAARIRVYSLRGELPELPLASPQRHAAFYLEEFTRWCCYFGARDAGLAESMKAVDRYARWCRYVGFDTMWDTANVYGTTTYPTKLVDANQNEGWTRLPNYPSPLTRLVALTAERHGLGLILDVHPALRGTATLDRYAAGEDIQTRNRLGAKMLNPLHPAVQRWATDMICEAARTCVDSPALRGVSFRWMEWQNPGFAIFSSREWGYDDYSVARFVRETGVQVPDLSGDDRFQKRFDWIQANASRPWSQWRTRALRDYYGRIATALRKLRPDLRLYVQVFGRPQDFGIDNPELFQGLDGVVFVPASPYPVGRRDRDPETFLASYAPQLGLDPNPIRATFDAAAEYNEYMEADFDPDPLRLSPNPTPGRARSVRICGVLSPAGRHFLARYAHAMAIGDQRMMADGGLGYILGQPEYLREFNREFRPLPPLDFKRLPADDPVALWQAPSKGRTVLCVVNRSDVPARVTIDSTPKLSIDLPAYAVRSLSLAGGPVTAMHVTMPGDALAEIGRQLQAAKRLLAFEPIDEPRVLSITTEGVEAARVAIDKAQAELQAGRIVAARRYMTGPEAVALYRAIGTYPPHLGRGDVVAVDSQVPSPQTTPPLAAGPSIVFEKYLGDTRELFADVLSAATDHLGRVYLLFADGRLVLYRPDGAYLKTLASLSSDVRDVHLDVRGSWVMLGKGKRDLPAPLAAFVAAARAQAKPEVVPVNDGPLQSGPDGRIYFLSPRGGGPWSGDVPLMALDPATDQFAQVHPGPRQQWPAAFALDTQGNVYYAGRFGSPNGKGCGLERFRHADDDSGKPEWLPTGGDLGGDENTCIHGILALPDGSVLVRFLTDWTRLRLERLAPDGKRTPFFDVQEHYGLAPHENIYAMVKGFHPSALMYHLEPYPDGGMILVVEVLSTVFRLTPEGKVVWAAGVRPEQSGEGVDFGSPRDAAVDGRGNVWVVDTEKSAIACLSPTGKVLTRLGHFGNVDSRDGSGFNHPEGIAIGRGADGADHFYVADTGNFRYAKFKLTYPPKP